MIIFNETRTISHSKSDETEVVAFLTAYKEAKFLIIEKNLKCVDRTTPGLHAYGRVADYLDHHLNLRLRVMYFPYTNEEAMRTIINIADKFYTEIYENLYELYTLEVA